MSTLTGGRGWLTVAAAASIHRIDAELGHRLQITEAGRTWAQQKVFWDRYQRQGYPIALHPDTPSVHQIGNAIDSDEAQRHLRMMTRHGWRRTVYRNGKLVEPWHFEYSPTLDQHLPAPAGTGSAAVTPTPIEEDLIMRFLYVSDSGGNLWTLLNVSTGELIQTREQERANSWAEAWGNARVCSLQGFADALAAVKATTAPQGEVLTRLEAAIGRIESQIG